ncbi:MAG: cellulase family glycosylhydrolase [Eggerthellaceae bacterium]|nr:cellulase family glycosylhydrolase [Eggerthellaceae bacterium]
MRAARAAVGAVALAAALLLAGCAAGPDRAPEAPADPPAAEAPVDAAASAAGDDAAAGDAPATPSTAGALKVVGTQLCASDGAPVQLRGVSTHGLAWFPQYVNADLFRELREDWGANVVRLALYTAESGGYCAGGDRSSLDALVRDGVAWAADADLYCIVDWHVLSDQDPLAHADEAVAFFSALSADLAGRDNVLYEICNEPNGSATWDDVRAYAARVIPAIRANDPDAVILVGTPEWSQRVDQAAAAPLDEPNVMYSLHFYAATHGQDLRDRLAAAVGEGLPVFVSEFGICDASGNGAIDYASADAWVALMDELDVSYVCWNLANKDEASSLIKAGCDKVSGLTADDLSEEGAWLWEVLHGERPAEGAGTPGAQAGRAAPEGESQGAGADGGAGSQGAGPLAEAGSDGDVSWTARVRQTWEADGATVYLYDLAVCNDGAVAVDGWSIAVPLDGPVAIQDSWNGTFDAGPDALRVGNAPYNGSLAAGAQAADVGLIVTRAPGAEGR